MLGLMGWLKERLKRLFQRCSFGYCSRDVKSFELLYEEDKLLKLRKTRITILILFLISSQILLITFKYHVLLLSLIFSVVTVVLSISWFILKFYDLLKTGRIKTLYAHILIFVTIIMVVVVVMMMK